MQELIERWNQFCSVNGYEEVVYLNDGLEEVIKQIYGCELSATQVVDFVRDYIQGSYTDSCKYWWIDGDGTIGGCHTTRGLPIDYPQFNRWCRENGYDMPWVEEE